MKTVSPRKPGLHPRNRHQQRYDFAALQRACPALSAFLRPAPSGDQTIDFADPEAVKCLNKALLAHFYGVAQWDIPEGFLCPPVPGRADYIHYLADLLGDGGEPPRQAMILDVGVGANCIYPLIGLHEYGWRFTGSEVNEQALKSANAIIAANPGMARGIRLRRQKDPQAFFNGIIHKNERYDATLCNPPFHDSADAARQSSERKRTNLGINNRTSALNFGGQQQELWCEGGEVAFIKGMIGESINYAQQVLWFTTLVSRAENLPFLYRALQEAGAVKVVKMEMSQGQKQSRVIAWSFLDEGQRRRWAASRDGARD